MPFLRPGLFLLLTLAGATPLALAQGAPPDDDFRPGVRFNGLGRAYIQQADLGGQVTDSSDANATSLSDGAFLLDLAIGAQPNRTTEVQGVIRLRNEFGGFFGSGVSVEVRELWARGIIANALEWRLGDMDLAMTPFTVFLPVEDGRVNTPELFDPQKEVIYYEEFYTGMNERRFQGGRLDFGFSFDRYVSALDARAFLARLRPTNFTDTPARYLAGGRLGATSEAYGAFQAKAGLNLVSVWDDLESGNANTGIRNHVVTGDLDLSVLRADALALSIVGEGGYSIAKFATEDSLTAAEGPLLRETDTFIEAGLRATLPRQDVVLSALFVNVGPDFFSAAAQSKRIDYTRPRSLFNRVGGEQVRRPIGLFDLTRDESVYTYRVQDGLMRHDPRYNNALPYGRATPNRRGARLGATYAPQDGPLSAELLGAYLQEIRGQGTSELKDFVLVRAAADLAVAPLIGYGKDLGVTLGLQVENTSRGGEALEAVDLQSVLLEAGLTVEVYDRLDVLTGLTYRTSDGRDYVPLIENFNDVQDFPSAFVTDDSELLVGAGLRYRFGPNTYLTVQYQHYGYDAATPATDLDPDAPPTSVALTEDYTLGQVFALYSMTF